MVTDRAALERETFRRLAHYTRAIDMKDWGKLSEVFAGECAKYRIGLNGLSGELELTGGETIIRDLATSLGRCGSTQHLLGNHVAELLGGGEAESSTYVRAFHRGAGQNQDLCLEVLGEYVVRWRLLAEGWRAVRWSLRVIDAIGDPKAVAPPG